MTLAHREDLQDAMDWINVLLDRHVRTATVPLTVRTFTFRGIQYRCANGPWQDSLIEAILAHKRKIGERVGKPE